MGCKLFCVKDITDSLLVHHLHITTSSTYGRMQIWFITVGDACLNFTANFCANCDEAGRKI